MGLVGSKGGTSCTRSDTIFSDKLVSYDLLMTSFTACISGWLRRGRWMGCPQDRGDGLQHACHQVLQHQHHEVTRCRGVIALSWVVNNLILTIPPLITENTNHHKQHWLPKLSQNFAPFNKSRRSRRVEGTCTSSKHCWAGPHISLLNPTCQ